MRVTQVVDPDISVEDAASLKELGIRPMKQLSEALEDPGIHAVIVSSPTDKHFQHINQALTSGRHVFTEKPLGKSAEDIQKCYALARQQDKCLYLGFQRRYDRHFQALKQHLPEIGDIRLLKASSRDNPPPALEYLKISGNIFHDMLIHDFDMLIHLLGVGIPESVYACGHAYDEQIGDIPDHDTVQVTIQYPQGLICSIDTSRSSVYGYDQRLELFGGEGMLTVHNQRDNTLQLHQAQGTLKQPIRYSFPQRYQDAYRSEMLHFLAGIQGGEQHNVSLQECLLSHLLAEAAHKSIMESRTVNFPTEYGLELNSGYFDGRSTNSK